MARLATQTATGRIDLVPMTFALEGDRLVTAVDHKPKTTTALKRLENIRVNAEVSVLVDQYDDADWDRLWWVRLRGLASVVEPVDDVGSTARGGVGDPGRELHERAIAALVAKYPQYRDRPPTGPVILIELVRWQWWSAAPDRPG